MFVADYFVNEIFGDKVIPLHISLISLFSGDFFCKRRNPLDPPVIGPSGIGSIPAEFMTNPLYTSGTMLRESKRINMEGPYGRHF